ncbi:hypothetical protein BDP27DRAFT_1334503 [Rhodocollybia butyracea]|uniref:Uncharacterized protein n=1 Tax=Rhodocollybia butyracea TaxID=206335 RepID=A0A9P5PJN3_9AGAR|nr:hypothetical protein BDP27DRAFT_1334503 [Rhodocollybia butyracea]
MKFRPFKRIAKLFRRHRAFQHPPENSISTTSYATHSQSNYSHTEDELPAETLNQPTSPSRPNLVPEVLADIPLPLSAESVPQPTLQLAQVEIGSHVMLPYGSFDYLLRVEDFVAASHSSTILPGEIRIIAPNVFLTPGRRTLLLIGGENCGNEYVAQVIKSYAAGPSQGPESRFEESGIASEQSERGVMSVSDRVERSVFAAQVESDAIPRPRDVTRPFLTRELGPQSSIISHRRLPSIRQQNRKTAIIGTHNGLPAFHGVARVPSSDVTVMPLTNSPELQNAASDSEHAAQSSYPLLTPGSRNDASAIQRYGDGNPMSSSHPPGPTLAQDFTSATQAAHGGGQTSPPSHPPGLRHPSVPLQAHAQRERSQAAAMSPPIPEYIRTQLEVSAPQDIIDPTRRSPLQHALNGTLRGQASVRSPFVQQHIQEFEEAQSVPEPAGYVAHLVNKAKQDPHFVHSRERETVVQPESSSMDESQGTGFQPRSRPPSHNIPFSSDRDPRHDYEEPSFSQPRMLRRLHEDGSHHPAPVDPRSSGTVLYEIDGRHDPELLKHKKKVDELHQLLDWVEQRKHARPSDDHRNHHYDDDEPESAYGTAYSHPLLDQVPSGDTFGPIQPPVRASHAHASSQAMEEGSRYRSHNEERQSHQFDGGAVGFPFTSSPSSYGYGNEHAQPSYTDRYPARQTPDVYDLPNAETLARLGLGHPPPAPIGINNIHLPSVSPDSQVFPMFSSRIPAFDPEMTPIAPSFLPSQSGHTMAGIATDFDSNPLFNSQLPRATGSTTHPRDDASVFARQQASASSSGAAFRPWEPSEYQSEWGSAALPQSDLHGRPVWPNFLGEFQAPSSPPSPGESVERGRRSTKTGINEREEEPIYHIPEFIQGSSQDRM